MVVFYYGLNDRKSLQVTRTLLSIRADLCFGANKNVNPTNYFFSIKPVSNLQPENNDKNKDKITV